LLVTTVILSLYGLWSQKKAVLSEEKINELLRRDFEASEKLNAERTKYFSILSHELRTPIFTITGLAKLLRKPENHTEDNIEAIINSGDHLLHLVNNILQHNKLKEPPQISLEEIDFNLSEICKKALQTTSYLARQKRTSVTILEDELPHYVVGDRQKLEQVLINLISNSIRYSYPNGSV
jgi:signal transduction histidine kinase